MSMQFQQVFPSQSRLPQPRFFACQDWIIIHIRYRVVGFLGDI